MLVHSLALLAIYAKHSAHTRVLTITLDSLPALRPSRAGSKSTAHWPLRASFQVSLNPAQQAGRLCLRPSATPLLRTEEGAQQLACLFLLRVGFIILQSAATRAPLPTGSVLGHPGPSPPAGRGTTRPCRRLGPALTTTGQNVTLRSAHDHSCQRLLHSPSSNHLSQIRATDLPGWGERDEESTRTRTGTFRRLHGVGIHAYLFGQLFAQCRTACINTHAALLMVDMLGSIPKGSHCNTSHLYCLGCTLQIMYHENTRLGESSISRHKARSGGFGTFFRGVWSSNPTRDIVGPCRAGPTAKWKDS